MQSATFPGATPLPNLQYGGVTENPDAPERIWTWRATSRVPWPLALARYAVALGLVATLVAWFSPRPTNLASEKRVLTSGTCGKKPTHSPWPAEPHRLVDGKLDRSYDVCTAASRAPWVRIDLGADAKVGRVVVHGRQDCCWQEGLPLVLEFSRDGATFHPVARRTLPFTRDDPWQIQVRNESARFLQLRVEGGSDKALIALSEVEAFPP